MKQFNLEEYLKDPSRKVVTRDNRNVTIHCTNFDEFTPIIAEIEGDIYTTAFCKNGKIIDDKDTSCDLFFAPEKYEGWVNIYVDSENNMYTGAWIHKSKDDAEKTGKDGPGYITTIKIEWEK